MNTHTHITLKAFFTAATMAAAVATGAHAADVPQVRVSYADLDLGTPAGAAQLNRRIKFAAGQVCGSIEDPDLARQAQFKACTSRAIADAVAALKSSNVKLASLK